jgi:hypothetical protein
MSLPDNDTPPPRDPLLDDPAFAEIVGPAQSEPLYAEPVNEPGAELPVAEVVPGQPVSLPPEALPRAVPVRMRSEPPPANPPANPSRPAAPPDANVKPRGRQWFAACSVLGCLGIAMIASIAALAWIAITLLGQIGEKIAKQGKENPLENHAVIHLGPIAPTALASDMVLPLPAAVDAVGRGADGRLLLLRAPRLHELLVFDANQGTIVYRVPLGEPNALFAAGKTKLFVYKPGARRIVRFDLASGQSEFELPKPQGINLVDALAIGPDSNGPLYLISAPPHRGSQVHVINGSTLELNATYALSQWKGRSDQRASVHASRDGTLLGVAGSDGAFAIHFDQDKAEVVSLAPDAGSPPALAIPSPDGHFLYTPRGVFSPAGDYLLGTRRGSFFTFPTAHGSGLFLSLSVEDGKVEGYPHLHLAGTETAAPIVTLGSGEVSGDLPANELREITAADRVHLWPDAGLLAVLPVSNSELQLFKVNVAATLADTKKAFVAFASDPPTTVRRGAVWQYAPRFYPRTNVTPKLSFSGPPEMNLKATTLTWVVPRNESGFVDVSLTAEIQTPGLKRVSAVQKFRIAIVE